MILLTVQNVDDLAVFFIRLISFRELKIHSATFAILAISVFILLLLANESSKYSIECS